MKEKIKLIVTVVVVIIFGGCHIFGDPRPDLDIILYFEQSQIGVGIGGMAVGVLKVEPPEGLRNHQRVEYSIANSDIAAIHSSTRNSVTVVGRREGQTLLTAKVGGNEAMTVVSVINLN